MHDQINSRANTILWILFAVSARLFVIASSNVANLVLARTVRREPELAVRSALGATTGVLRRSLLAESLVLCGSGAMAAVVLAIPMVAVLGQYAQRFSVRAKDLSLDFSLVWFGIALALIAAVFLALIPRLPSPDAPQGGLTGGEPRVAGGSSRRLRIFAVTQISLVPAAGRSVCADEDSVCAGADAAAVRFGQRSGSESAGDVVWEDAPAGGQFYREVQRRVSALPGVDQVSAGFGTPWRDDRGLSISFKFAAAGAKPRATAAPRFGRSSVRCRRDSLIPSACRMVAGRDFNDGDKDGAERVVIISQSLAKSSTRDRTR